MSQTQVSFSLFAQSAQQQSECPPAGASQEVNEAAPSLAAPSASGQQAGTPIAFHGVLGVRRGLSLDLAEGGFDGDWWLDWQAAECLDAAERMPSGSHVPFVFGEGQPWAWAKADGYGAVPRRYLG